VSRRGRLVLLSVVAAIVVVMATSVVTFHHAVLVFLNAGQPTGCGGG